MTAITNLNYSAFLKQSTTARASSPNGNVYFDLANNSIQLIGVDELATINFGGDTTAGQTISSTTTGYTRVSGSFLTNGFAVGHVVTVTGFVDADCNGTKTITAVSALSMTVAETTGMSAEAGTGNERIQSAAQTNPLTNADGVTMRALYNFENLRRRVDETMRKYKRGTDGDYRYVGAFNFVNGVKLASNDRRKIRGSGFIEYANTLDGQTNIDRIYHGVKSLNSIQAGTTSYWTLTAATNDATLLAATWTDFFRTGAIDEVVQVYGSTAYSDAGAGNFDYRTRILSVRVRSWGYNPGETTSTATGITEFSGYSAGYGVGETLNPNNTYAIADVFGGARIAPWTGMTLEKLGSPQVETGFNESNGNFTWRLNNTGGGTAQQCAAYLDAVTLQNADIDAGAGVYNGKQGRVWYTRNSSGKIVTNSTSGEGLVIQGLSTAEKQNVIFTDNAGATKTYPFFPDVQISVGSAAIADPNAWFHVFYADGAGAADFDTVGAVTVNDYLGNPVKGNVSASAVAQKISFAYAYDTNTQAGLSAAVDKEMVVLVEGDGGAGQALTAFTTTRSTVVAVTCAPTTDTNA